ncbi:MAG: tRNA (adenosine(37)-N6)-dimethylallyltransferase MiaA [Lachnospiraceae bacterium]|nr:tRNA (adenosine(37)-N6)-dimethylallyltransferase MiaA [Lachnospiraceae bacterium]
MMNKRKVIVLTGPTAVGKTKLSIDLAKQIGGEIISADSMQIYRYMDIGSAKIKTEEMQGIPHYLIDCLLPGEEFNVTVFQGMAKKAMEEIWSKNKIPIIVGGTGFYIQSVLYDIDFTENNDNGDLRKQLEETALEKGAGYLHEMLTRVDPESAAEIHENNVKRVIRALEYYQLTGEKISVHNKQQREKSSPYDVSFFVLNDKRELLYKRIDQRVDEMMKEGLLEEVKQLQKMGYDRSYVSMQGLGYKEIFSFLEGEITLEEAVYIIKRDTRHFAKRQITWFKREREVIWINKDEFSYDDQKILSYMMERI